MKRPPDPSPLHSSSLSPPLSLRSLAFTFHSWLDESISHPILPLKSIGCSYRVILSRIACSYVSIGFDSVKIACCMARSGRGWPCSSQIWKSLVSTIQGHLLHVPDNDDLLYSARSQICDMVGVESWLHSVPSLLVISN